MKRQTNDEASFLDRLAADEKRLHLPTYGRQPVAFVRGKGGHLWDSDGKRYADFLSGLGVVNIGHCRPEVLQAFDEQAGRLVHVSNLFYTEPQIDLAKELSRLTFPAKFFFANSGAEANEGAIKLARRHGKKLGGPGKSLIITAENSFHGRTLKALAATGQPAKRQPFEPLPGGFIHVPFNDLGALEEQMSDEVCALMLEPIQGEGGVYPAEVEYLTGARDICDRHGALLIMDEVQTGLGRTGLSFGYQHFSVLPDIITLAKSLANGLPIGAIVASPSVSEAFSAGDHGSTFGGGPAICAAARAVISILVSEELPERAARQGAVLKEGLAKVADSSGEIAEIRGVGLMLGVQMLQPKAKKVVSDMLAAGFVINNIGDSIIRFLPPLVVEDEDIFSMLDHLEKSLKAVK